MNIFDIFYYSLIKGFHIIQEELCIYNEKTDN